MSKNTLWWGVCQTKACNRVKLRTVCPAISYLILKMAYYYKGLKRKFGWIPLEDTE